MQKPNYEVKSRMYSFRRPCRDHYAMYLHLNPHTTHLYQNARWNPNDPHCEEHKYLDSNAPAQTDATPRYLFAQSPKMRPWNGDQERHNQNADGNKIEGEGKVPERWKWGKQM